jgi:hypothetical protein
MNFSKLSRVKIENNENNSSINDIPSIKSNNYNSNNDFKYEKYIIKRVLVTTDNYNFEITLSKDTISDEYFTIYSSEKECCGIMKDNLEHIVYIRHLNFFETCAKNKSLINKTGTIEMLFCILQYVRDYYKTEFKYIFQDDSSIKINDTILSLKIIYILLYGETWYMKYIDAQPDDIRYSESLNILNNYLDSTKDNIIYFFKFTINENNNSNNNSQIDTLLSDKIFILFKNKNVDLTKKKLLNEIKKIYKKSVSSREFLLELYKKYGMIIFLVINYFGYYKKILEKLKIKLYDETDIVIPLSVINNIDVIRNIQNN